MIKTFMQAILLVMLSVTFAGEVKLSALANSKNPLNLKTDSKSKRLPIENKTKKSKNDLRYKNQALPILFEENKGQINENIKFLSRNSGYNFYLSQAEVIFSAAGLKQTKKRPALVKMKMSGANPQTEIKGIDETVAKSNYLIGNDSSRWQTGIANYKGIRYEKIYDGIDAGFRASGENLEYDFYVAPQADPNLIRLDFEGLKKIKINRKGDLILLFKGGEIRHRKPFAYQIIDGEKLEVAASYILLDKNRVGFKIGNYDADKELIIDPVIYATYLGGSRQDATHDIAIGSFGEIYLASEAQSEDFLDANGLVDKSVANDSDIFITKLNAQGTEIIYNTFVGGSRSDIPWALDIDAVGNVYVGGQTSSTDFPMVFANQTNYSIETPSDVEGIVFKLNSFGSGLSYSTYHGATSNLNGYHTDWVESIDVDRFGNLYAVGRTGGTNFPLLNGYQMSLTGDFGAFLSKYDSTGNLLYSTLFCGAENWSWTAGYDVAVDEFGFAYLSGEVAYGSQIPLTPNAYQSSGTGFVAKFDTNNTGGSSLVYSTYINSPGEAIEIDADGNATTLGSATFSRTGNGVKLSSTGTGAFFTFITYGRVSDLAINQDGNIYFTEDIDDPTDFRLDYNVRVKGFSPAGISLGTTWIEGSHHDRAAGIALDSDNFIWVTGYTFSLDFPTTSDALQPQSRYAIPGGSSVQGFLVKVKLDSRLEDLGPTDCQGSVGKPVNVATGNMYLQQTDYALPSIGESISVTRTYNSMKPYPGYFGIGWRTEYNEYLAQYDFTTLILETPDGKEVYFTKAADGIFVPETMSFYGQITVDSSGNYLLKFKDGRIHKFNSNGLLTALIDRDNNQTAISYDDFGRIASITNAAGQTLSITTDEYGRIVGLSDAVGEVAAYSYNSDFQLETVTYADGSKFSFSYEVQTGDEGDRVLLTEVKDALNNIIEKHEYYPDGRAKTSERQDDIEKYTLEYVSPNETHVTDALGRLTKYFIKTAGTRRVVERVEGVCGCAGSQGRTQIWEYDDRLNVTKKIDGNGRETVYTYDANGNVLTETDATGTKTYTYNLFSQVLTATDQMNGVTTNTYDEKGNLLTATDALGNTTAFTYTTAGQIETVKDALDNTTTFIYDAQNRLSQVKDANEKMTNYAYDDRSRLTSVTNALNFTTAFEYDPVNRLKKITHADGRFITNAYDLAGRKIAATDERGNTTNYGYDNAYRLISITDALGHTTTYGYDLMSNLISQTDALGNTTNLEYDEFNRLKRTIYPPTGATGARLEERIEYDAVGSVKRRIDTANRETLYDYDAARRLIKTTDAANQITQFEYNPRSQMTKVKDALNQEYAFTYDALGRQLTQTRAGKTMRYEYDAVGNRKRRIDYKNQVTRYNYDNLNRLRKIIYPANPAEDVTFTYDALSRLQKATNYAGTIDFNYNRRNRITSVLDVHGKKIGYTYDPNGNRKSFELDDILQAGYTYDRANRLQTITNAEDGAVINYNYDAANRLKRKILPNDVTTVYAYDEMSRLSRIRDFTTSSNTTINNRIYSYNQANQISQIKVGADSRSFGYDSLDRLTSVTGATAETYNYDAVGNRTISSQSPLYIYQPFNKLASTATANYAYDANGNLTGKTDISGTTQYVWDFENRLRQVVKPDGSNVIYKYDALGRRSEQLYNDGTSTKFTYDGLDVVFDQNSDGSSVKYLNGLGIDNKLRMTANGQARYFLSDHLGSTTGLADASGTITEKTTYDSFGNPVNADFPTRYQYTGREFDNFTGLHYYRARFYDAQLGRFISEDPIGFRGDDINLYGYVWNNPTNFKDASGLFPSRGIWKFHQEIIQNSLNGIATQGQIDILKQEQYDFDKNTQDEPYAPWHAMGRIGQGRQDARNEANQFIKNQICLARKLAKRGFEAESLRYLSRAIHTLQDSTSPAHFDFQEAWNDSFIWHLDHYISESLVEPLVAELAERQTKKAWDYYKGANMPNDFFESNLYDSRFGPSFSPSKTSKTMGGVACECE